MDPPENKMNSKYQPLKLMNKASVNKIPLFIILRGHISGGDSILFRGFAVHQLNICEKVWLGNLKSSIVR